MAISTLEVSQAVKSILNATTTEEQETLKAILNQMLLSSLSPLQLQVYNALRNSNWVTSADIAGQFDININHASNVLAQLRELGLVQGQPITGRYGLHYEWHVVQFP